MQLKPLKSAEPVGADRSPKIIGSHYVYTKSYFSFRFGIRCTHRTRI